MKKIILILFMFVFVLNSLTALDYHYEINLTQNETELFLEELDVGVGELNEEEFFGDSLLQVFSFENKILFEMEFKTYGRKITEDPLNEPVSNLFYLSQIELFVPYYSNANQIIIYDENLTEKLVIDVSMYSKIEEGAFLGEGEDEEGVGDGVTDRESRDSPKELVDYWWILLIVLIILIFIFVISLKKKKSKKTVQYRR